MGRTQFIAHTLLVSRHRRCIVVASLLTFSAFGASAGIKNTAGLALRVLSNRRAFDEVKYIRMCSVTEQVARLPTSGDPDASEVPTFRQQTLRFGSPPAENPYGALQAASPHCTTECDERRAELASTHRGTTWRIKTKVVASSHAAPSSQSPSVSRHSHFQRAVSPATASPGVYAWFHVNRLPTCLNSSVRKQTAAVPCSLAGNHWETH